MRRRRYWHRVMEGGARGLEGAAPVAAVAAQPADPRAQAEERGAAAEGE